MFDPDQLDPEARALWDELHPQGPSTQDGPQVTAWSFGYACMLVLGRVPEIVSAAIEPDTGAMLRAYKEARLAAWRASREDGPSR